MIWVLIIILFVVILLVWNQPDVNTRENYYDPVSCVIMFRVLKNAIKTGELTNDQANLLWMVRRYDMDCGSQIF